MLTQSRLITVSGTLVRTFTYSNFYFIFLSVVVTPCLSFSDGDTRLFPFQFRRQLVHPALLPTRPSHSLATIVYPPIHSYTIPTGYPILAEGAVYLRELISVMSLENRRGRHGGLGGCFAVVQDVSAVGGAGESRLDGLGQALLGE
ncbi:hypothetical protein QBC32DRAFT_348254 [Pseudoneurospora amorphoporcata]|uniref:Uncharacterized protein n=1 Tax=Pseudoneurospora amorphoporcata TaxID=241081 RepID=A0AAN6NTX5_9PEZI|nr:hypothetical protein QBC32DRAFT_348254 [Pseudoneurospora amorphoporcata]